MVAFARLIEIALKTRTEEELAQALICSQQAISDYRTGKSVPRNSKIEHYAKVLKVPVDKLRRIFETERAKRDEASGAVSAIPETSDQAGAQP